MVILPLFSILTSYDIYSRQENTSLKMNSSLAMSRTSSLTSEQKENKRERTVLIVVYLIVVTDVRGDCISIRREHARALATICSIVKALSCHTYR